MAESNKVKSMAIAVKRAQRRDPAPSRQDIMASAEARDQQAREEAQRKADAVMRQAWRDAALAAASNHPDPKLRQKINSPPAEGTPEQSHMYRLRKWLKSEAAKAGGWKSAERLGDPLPPLLVKDRKYIGPVEHPELMGGLRRPSPADDNFEFGTTHGPIRGVTEQDIENYIIKYQADEKALDEQTRLRLLRQLLLMGTEDRPAVPNDQA